MRNIDCTTVSWVQEKSNLAARENIARRYSTKVSKRKENIEEVLCGVIISGVMCAILILGFIF